MSLSPPSAPDLKSNSQSQQDQTNSSRTTSSNLKLVSRNQDNSDDSLMDPECDHEKMSNLIKKSDDQKNTENAMDEKEEEFKVFEYALQLLPQYRYAFPEIDYKSILRGLTDEEWKTIIINEIIDYIPTHLLSILKPYPPNHHFFDCRKPIFDLSRVVIDYLFDLNGIYQALNQTQNTVFRIVNQSPNYIPVNGISAYFVLIIQLVKYLPWDNFTDTVQKKVLKEIDTIRAELRKLQKHGTKLYKLSGKIIKKCNGVFENGPELIEIDVADRGVDKEALRRPVIKFSDPRIIKPSSATIGMIGETKLTVGIHEYELNTIKNTIILGLLVSTFEHIIYILRSLNQKLIDIEKEMKSKFYIPKWRNVVSYRLSPFELSLLHKSNRLLKTHSSQLQILCQRIKLETEFLYEYNERFKILKKYAFEEAPGVVPGQLLFEISMFNMEIHNNQKFWEYLVSGHWRKSEAAMLVTYHYLFNKQRKRLGFCKF